MKLLLRLVISLFFTFFLIAGGFAKGAGEWNVQTVPEDDLGQAVPVDPSIRIGTLENGLTYYIKRNSKPKDRVILRLAVNVGSILEDQDQQGIAHFTEHMAFNGTENFEKQEIVDYMETVGMQFGPDVNAHTNYDETIYKLNVATDDPEVVETAFSILSEWAFRISFQDDEVDKERGVVIEEWRLGRGAEARMKDQYFPVLFKGSKYAERRPIGKMEIIESFSYETVKRFYNDWYRPDLMAVIVTGDIDPDRSEDLIRKYFAGEPGRENKREREISPVPDHKETLFSVVTDPETVNSVIRVYYKHDISTFETYGEYRKMIVERLLRHMFNARLEERTREADPPYIFGITGDSRLVRSKSAYYLAAVVDDKGIEKGMEALLTEARRVEKFGFTNSELQRAKQDLMKQMEMDYNERDKTDSVVLATEYIRNFMMEMPIPGIEFEWQFYRQNVPEITLDDIRDQYEAWLADENRVIIVTAPEKDTVSIPREEELRKVLTAAKTRSITPYEDVVADSELMPALPKPGSITGKQSFKKTGVTEFTLSNGARVVLKPTDFKNDQILFSAFSEGGSSLVEDADFISAVLAGSVISQGGIGSIDLTQLQKLLAGKSVYTSPYIGSLTEGFSGSSTPDDLEILFQLIHLYMTEPRADREAYTSFMTRIEGLLRNQESDPMFLYQKELIGLLTDNHFRSQPLTVESLKLAEFETVKQVYRKRFQDAGDFTFLFTGAFSIEDIEPLVKLYLASLPSVEGEEKWIDRNVPLPKGVIQREIRKGLEPQGRVSIVYSGLAHWSIEERFLLDAMGEVLSLKLREKIREDEGGTYGTHVSTELARFPREQYSVMISFGCDPERADELKQIVYQEVEGLRNSPPEELYITKVREGLKHSYQEALEKNGFWLDELESAYFHNLDPETILLKNERYDSLDAEMVYETALLYLNPDNFVELILYPEE